jgi:hypothetical protein
MEAKIMADKTTKVFVRLTRDFPAGATHRRGGFTLGAGPQPVEGEVTKEQLAALKADRYVEIVDEAEAEKWNERLSNDELTHASSAELEEADQNADGGRNYDEGTDEGDGDGSDEGSDSDGDEEGDEEGSDEPETAEQLAKAHNRDALIAIAKEEQVEGLDFEDTQATTKKVIAEAIVAKRAETETE